MRATDLLRAMVFLVAARSLDGQTQRPPATGSAAQAPNGIISSYIDQARAFGDAGHADSALAILSRLFTDHPEIPQATIRNRTALETIRYQLVGRKPIQIVFDHLLNKPTGAQPLLPPGRVTLIQFTAHWCGPCQTSYGALNEVAARFGNAVHIVLVTELYGQFDGKPVKPDVELRSDSSYFARVLAKPFQVAISNQPPPPVVPGTYGTANTNAYAVDALPQIVLLDARGIVRRIFVGGDFQHAGRLLTAIDLLLASP